MTEIVLKTMFIVGAIIIIWSTIKRRNIEKQLKTMNDNDIVPEYIVKELHKFINLYVTGVLITSVAGFISLFLR